MTEPDKVFGDLDITHEIKQKLFSEIKYRLGPKAIKVRTDFEVKCYTADVNIS